MYLTPRKKTENSLWLNPFREMDRIQNQLNSLFNWSLGEPLAENRFLESAWAPSMDYDETEENVIVRIDVPGVDKKNLSAMVRNGVLVVKGERKDEKKSNDKGTRLTERYYGRFYRELVLPTAVDESKVEASYKDGVLELILPKKEDAKPKQIQIDVR